ncbi:hypothetical protein BKA62DRAFT_676786 [Auriculariales sp. MPI-PUGE-AT-0066]|nr:hypothetical protein BKA62DRAFT_676786 [Auriculariales sp. MPI-PUGE-AT-0066]
MWSHARTKTFTLSNTRSANKRTNGRRAFGRVVLTAGKKGSEINGERAGSNKGGCTSLALARSSGSAVVRSFQFHEKQQLPVRPKPPATAQNLHPVSQARSKTSVSDCQFTGTSTQIRYDLRPENEDRRPNPERAQPKINMNDCHPEVSGYDEGSSLASDKGHLSGTKRRERSSLAAPRQQSTRRSFAVIARSALNSACPFLL